MLKKSWKWPVIFQEALVGKSSGQIKKCWLTVTNVNKVGVHHSKLYREGWNIIWRFRGEGVCSNRQSTVIWRRGLLPNRHIAFIVAEKLNTQFLLLFFRLMWGEKLAENVKIQSYGGERSLKLLKNTSYDNWTFPYQGEKFCWIR